MIIIGITIAIIVIILILFYYLRYITNLVINQTNIIIKKMAESKVLKIDDFFCYKCGEKTNSIGMGLYDCPNCKETYQLHTDKEGAECAIKTSTIINKINVSEN